MYYDELKVILNMLTGWGYSDVEQALTDMDDAGIEAGDLDLPNLLDDEELVGDLNYYVYYAICEKAEAHDLISYIYDNAMCTSFDISESKAAKILAKADGDSGCIEWLIDECNCRTEYEALMEPEDEEDEEEDEE